MDVSTFKSEMNEACEAILGWWLHHTIDAAQGGFAGRVHHGNQVDALAPKGAVLNSRILWTFSAGWRYYDKQQYLQAAHRAFDYIRNHFIDWQHGGVFWSVDHLGRPLQTKKQVYAQAFALYGLAAYYRATHKAAALDLAVEMYQCMQHNAFDQTHGGYFEAFDRTWNNLTDQRLSSKDVNEKKSMNTNLHVLEAYTTLYRVWPSEGLKAAIAGLLQVFGRHIIDDVSGHLVLFFDEQWQRRSQTISYGHDVEAAWLLQEAAEMIGHPALLTQAKAWAIQLAAAAARGLDEDGGLWYEKDTATDHLVKEKHWWPQAEAMVGFVNAWQVSGQEQWLHRAIHNWTFTKNYLLDTTHGEWHWGVDEHGRPMTGTDKAGFWKCPYHNARACMEVMVRLAAMGG